MSAIVSAIVATAAPPPLPRATPEAMGMSTERLQNATAAAAAVRR